MERFYTDIYGGTALSGQALSFALARAAEQLEAFERQFTVTETVPDGRKKAICAMAEAMAYFEAAQNGQGGLRYASVGTVSISGKGIYSAVDISPKAQTQELLRCARVYLELYRGVPC